MDLLSSDDKAVFAQAMTDLFETNSEEITIYSTPQLTVLTSNPEFISVYSEKQDENTTYVPVSGTYDAWIVNIDSTNQNQMKNVPADLKMDLAKPLKKITVKSDVKEILKNCEFVDYDGERCRVASGQIKKRYFGADLYVFYLQVQ